MRNAKIDASEKLARRSVAVMGKEGAAEDTVKESQKWKKYSKTAVAGTHDGRA
jgi:hypothetical protein